MSCVDSQCEASIARERKGDKEVFFANTSSRFMDEISGGQLRILELDYDKSREAIKASRFSSSCAGLTRRPRQYHKDVTVCNTSNQMIKNVARRVVRAMQQPCGGYSMSGHMRLDYICEEERYYWCRFHLRYYPGDEV